MNRISKYLLIPVICMLSLFTGVIPAYAFAEISILPPAPKECVTEEPITEGNKIIGYRRIQPEIVRALKDSKKFGEFATKNASGDKSRREVINNLLGCAIKTGNVHLFMVPFFVTMLTQFLLSVAGVISVLFICLGGFKYAVGGLIEDKESGKKYIQYALLGLVVSLGAWMIVNFIMIVLTS